MKELCPVCRQAYIDQSGNGRSTSKTCGQSCSAIRNSVADDEAAARKYDKEHQGQEGYDRFCLGHKARREIRT